ncbi:MAG: hypothetical protein KDN19_20185 [Verrucomicrobiae bacterium]|nr:hypothetical protein [Verrucomicrobiae bacterium]
MSARQNTKTNQNTEANGGRGETPAVGSNGGDNVDKIRELLFGEQMVGYEARFKTLEAKLTAEIESMRQAVEDGLAELRTHLEKRADEVEDASVARADLADSLEKLAAKLRG